MIALRLAALDGATPATMDRWHETLDPDGRARAAGFRFAIDRDRFIARRGLLREWLGELTGSRPETLRIKAEAHGRPSLPDHPDLHFSSSHSADRWLGVAARGCAIGCDLEQHRPELADPAVAERLFAEEERAALGPPSDPAYIERFFACWTRKEAFVKALGLGLSYPLDAFAVSPDAPPRFLRGADGWALHAIDAGPGCSAALVLPASAGGGDAQ